MGDNGRYVADITIPDDTQVAPGTVFVKTWRVQNNGNTIWTDGYHLAFVGGNPMTDILGHPLPATIPGQRTDISLPLMALLEPGTYFGDWRFQNAGGHFIS